MADHARVAVHPAQSVGRSDARVVLIIIRSPDLDRVLEPLTSWVHFVTHYLEHCKGKKRGGPHQLRHFDDHGQDDGDDDDDDDDNDDDNPASTGGRGNRQWSSRRSQTTSSRKPGSSSTSGQNRGTEAQGFQCNRPTVESNSKLNLGPTDPCASRQGLSTYLHQDHLHQAATYPLFAQSPRPLVLYKNPFGSFTEPTPPRRESLETTLKIADFGISTFWHGGPGQSSENCFAPHEEGTSLENDSPHRAISHAGALSRPKTAAIARRLPARRRG